MRFRKPRTNTFLSRGNRKLKSRWSHQLENLEERRVLAAVPFMPTTVFEGGLGRSQQVEAVDLDGDGDLDAVALSGDGIGTFMNDGSGNFGELMEVPDRLARDARSMDVGDVDNDGDVDVVVGSIAGEEEASVSLFLNDGNGAFTRETIATGAITGFADSLDVADVNNDGALDIVTIARGNLDPEFTIVPGRFLIFMNQGGDAAGTFSAPVDLDYVLDSEPAAVHVTDINGDGMSDVVGSASYGYNHAVFWWTQNDDGTFKRSADIPTQAGPRFMDTADIDGDGDLDLVIPEQGNPDDFHPDQSGNRIILFENDGTTFINPTVVRNDIDGPERTLFRDMDADGDVDIVVAADNHDLVVILVNEGGGSFTGLVIVDDLATQASGLSIGDLDGDDDLDILSSSQFYASVNQHTNNGDGTWETIEITGPNTISPDVSLLADFDGDGDLDVLGMGSSDIELAWYENTDGEGTFNTRDQNLVANFALDISPRDTFWWHVDTGDIDNDGDIDVIASEPNFRQLVWYENDGSGNFVNQFSAAIPNTVPGIVEFEVADVDGDGDDDIAVVNAIERTFALHVNDGTGEFSRISISDTVDTFFGQITTGDIDGDGDLDVLAGDNPRTPPGGPPAPNASVTWYELIQQNDGTLLFDAVQTLETLIGEIEDDSFEDVKLGDMDGDGDMDAVIASDDDRNLEETVIRWYENTDGLGTFSKTENLIGIQPVVTHMMLADIDNDGDTDILSPNLGTEVLEWFDNQGDGTFVKQTVAEDVITSTSLLTMADAGDINGDGRTDLVAPHSIEDRIVAYISQFDPFDVNTDGEVNSDDADLVCSNVHTPTGVGDVNQDGVVNIDDMSAILAQIGSLSGDSNYDGTFGTPDLVRVFAAGEYEDGVPMNSTFAEGDWNCSGDFDTNDLVFVFTQGTFDPLAAVAAPTGEIASAIDQTDSATDEADVVRADDAPVAPMPGGPAILEAANVDNIFADGDLDPQSIDVLDIAEDELEI